MPIYKHKNDTYNIPDDKVEAFEKKFPDASIELMNGADRYSIPLSKRDRFMRAFPNATPYADDIASSTAAANQAVAEGEQPMQAAKDSTQNAMPSVETPVQQPVQPRTFTAQELDDYSKMSAEARQDMLGDATPQFEEQYKVAREKQLQQANREQITQLSADIDAAIEEKNTRLKEVKFSPLRMFAQAGRDPNLFNESTYAEDQELRDLNAAKKQIKDAQRTINEADINSKNGTLGEWLKQSFAGGAARGFGQKLFDVETWDLGISELKNNGSLLLALEKYDKGEELSNSEQMLLDAMSVRLATDAYFGSYVGRGYKAGTVTAESIPFMLEMCINPASATGKTAMSKLTRYALQRFGKGAATKALRIGGRVAGDIAGAAGMTATSGAARVTADMARRMGGDVQFDTADDGTSFFAGHLAGDDPMTAFRKAAFSQGIENYSEMVGEYFAPVLGIVGKAASKGLDKMGLGFVNDFVQNVSGSTIGKLVSDFESQAHWNGTIGEYAEEVVGGIMNALTVGDQTLDTDEQTGVFNLDQNIDTFLGVSLMGGVLSGVKTVGYRTPKHRARKEMEMADDMAAYAFGDQFDWGGVRNHIAFGTDEETKRAVNDVLMSKEYTEAQKKAMLQYAKSAMKYKGMLIGEKKRAESNNPLKQDLESSYDNGHTLDNQEMNDAKNMMLAKKNIVQELFGNVNVDDFLGGDPVSAIQSTDLANTDPKVLQAVIDYANAKATYDGMMDGVREDIEGKVAQSNAAVDKNTNKEVQLCPATMKVDDRSVYIINGNVAMFDDGTGVDKANSDKFVVIRDANTGKIETTSPEYILRTDEAIDAETQKSTLAEQIRQEEAQKAANKIDGKLNFAPGEKYLLTDEEGNQIEMSVAVDEQNQVLVDQNGNIGMTVDGQMVQYMPKEVVQKMSDATNAARLYEHIAAENAKNKSVSYELNDEVELNAEDGPVKGTIVGKTADGYQVQVERPIKGKSILQLSADELADLTSRTEDAETTPETTAETSGAASTSTATATTTPAAPASPADFVSMGAEAAYPILQEKYGDKLQHKLEVTAKAYNDALAKEQAKLDKAQQAYDDAPIGAEEKAEAALKKAQEAYDKAAAQTELWNTLVGMAAPVEETPEVDAPTTDAADAATEEEAAPVVEPATATETAPAVEEQHTEEDAPATEEEQAAEGDAAATDTETAEQPVTETAPATEQTDDTTEQPADETPAEGEQSSTQKAIAEAEAETDTNPTEGQKKAGNYKKGHVTVDGLDITIENPKGSERSGNIGKPDEWHVTMNNTYGYILGTEGVDGDHIDIFLSDDPESGDVYVVDQVKEDGTFDEHKVMYGFVSEDAAKEAYMANYSPGWKGFGAITHVSKEDFKKWIASSHRKTKPFADYAIAQKTNAVKVNNYYAAEDGSVFKVESIENGVAKGVVYDANDAFSAPVDTEISVDRLTEGIGHTVMDLTEQIKDVMDGLQVGDVYIFAEDDISMTIDSLDADKQTVTADNGSGKADIPFFQFANLIKQGRIQKAEGKARWIEGKKTGDKDSIVLPDGTRLEGRYVLVEASELIPSHNPFAGFTKTEGFPTDENGKTVNSRDYEHNKAYRQGVEDKARSYDERAIQEPVVVSQDGYVMSGNDRTMAGQLAAKNDTDAQYVKYLHDHAEKYGFTKENVAGMQSPRLVFVPDMQFEYTAKEFDAFNKDARKTEDKMAQTIKLGKIISPKTIAKIAAIIDEKETMSDIYSDKKAVNEIVNILIADGVLNENERAQMFDREQLSASGKDFVENVLVGAVLNEDSVYIVSEMKNVRQRIVKSVLLILQNKGFGEYSIIDNLNDAIKFLYEAKKAGFKDNVTDYMRSQNLFEDNPSDVYPAVVSLLADALNTTERKVKRVFELYNKEAAQASQGQLELFGDGALSSEEILTEVINTINGKNGKRQKEEGRTPEGTDAAEGGTTGEQGRRGTEEEGKGKSEGKQGVTKPESVLDKAKRIAEEEEARRAAEEAERNRDLTEDEINASDIDESLKVGALAYLKGNRSMAVVTAYQIVKDYVRNQSRISAADSSHADGTLVGSRADETTGGESGQSGSDGARLDREDGDGDVSGSRPGGETGTNDMAPHDGERGDRSLGGRKSGEGNVRTGSDGTVHGDKVRGGRRNGRKPAGHGNSGSVSDSNERGKTQAGRTVDTSDSGIRDDIEKLKDAFLHPLRLPRDRFYDATSLVAALGVSAVKVFAATAKLGYDIVVRGVHNYKKWVANMHALLDDLLHQYSKLTDDQMDEFIKSMWDYPYSYKGEVHTVGEWASILEQEKLRELVHMSIEEKRKLQKAAEGTETIVGDIDNIRESLPFLLPAQQEDVQKAEVQFFDKSHSDAAHGNGKGYMFTNGTGTGKTYTGLGIVKRFLKQGKGRVLIVTAQEKKINDWIRDAKNLGIEATMLQDTKSKGKGVVVTQYANIRQNYELLKDEFDLIVYDESHKLMENQTGEMTTTATFHHMLANRDVEQALRRGMQGSALWIKERELKDEMAHLHDLLKDANKEPKGEVLKEIKSRGGVEGIEEAIEFTDAEIKRVQKQQEEEIKKAIADPKKREAAQKAVDRTKVVFLSATPFNTASSLDYVESYIFSYPAEDQNTDRDKRKNTFIMDRFPSSHARDSKGGVRRLDETSINDPESASKEEIAFSDYLQNDLSTMSGRMLDSEYDYSREFPLVDIPEVKLFNKAVQELQNGKYAILKPYFDNIFKNYPEMTAIFEAIKTAGTIQRIKEHIALGRKVVIFHRRMNAKEALEPPFAKGLNNAINNGDATEKKAVAMFMKEYGALLMWEQQLDLSFPHEQITNAFATKEDRARYQKELEEWRVKAEKAKNAGKKIPPRPKLRATNVGLFNGTETQSYKEKTVADFNDDKSPVDVLVVQVQAGKEGIDLHDTTGGHQRVIMSLQLPQSPIEFIQVEGRIYRVGNMSNAIFEYPLLGIDLELASFSMKINGRSQTSENLALGSKARGLRDSIARSALASRPIPVEEGQGVGGKKLDDRSLQEATDYDTAVTNYAEWANESKEKDFDKMQTPDPIGYKMMEWAGMTNGETLLVPFAGTGTIARYAPTSVKLTALEGDMGRYAKLVTLIGGGGRKVEPDLFKDFHISNKTDCVVMNGEHSGYKDGLTDANHDVENLMKASRHLEQGGRIVAVVDAKNAGEVETALKNSSRGALVVSAEIKLPAAAFDGHKATVMVIDRVDNEDLRKTMPPKAETDLTGAKTKEELFKQMRDVKVPARVIDKVGKVKKRVERVAKRLDKCSLIRKTKMWKETVKNLYLRDTEISISFSPNTIAMPIPGYGPRNLYRNFELNYEKIADDNFDYIQEAAQLWMYLDGLTKMSDDDLYRRLYCAEKKMPEVRDTAETLKQCVAAALNKTEMQIKNIARGEMENKVSGTLSFEQFKEAFKSLNSNNAGLEALGKKVFDTVEKIDGMRFSVVTTNEMSGHNVVAHYVPSKNIIELNGDYFNSMRMKDEFKASTIIHEMIHAVTCYAVDAYLNGYGSSRLTKTQIAAVEDILAVYDAINNNEFRSALRLNSKMKDNAEYGLTNVYEMLAEMANPVFRAQLKAKKLWRQLVNGIKRLLGMDVTQEKGSETSALDVLENALDTLLDEFDPELYKEYTRGAYNNEMFNREIEEEDVRFRTSEELDEEYPEWLSGQTTGTGQHTTQITSTVNTYRKIGEWIGRNMPEATILDASSGLGKGTEALREMGFEVDDVEPYPSESRTEPTYRRYEDIDKKYDVVISNAVLNVIPDNWRRDVLHSMADKVNEGGCMVINVRDAKEMGHQKQKIELDSPSEILVTDKKGNIRAYQKGFTQKELTEWIKNELGEGWHVETANVKNSGITGRAVVVTRTDGDISREMETFSEGEQVAIEQTEDGLRVEGLGNEYADTFSLLDAWRNKYPNYFTSLSEDRKTLVVTSWDLKPRKMTAAESRHAKAYLQRKTENARRAVKDMAARLHLDNVEVMESTEGLKGKKAKAKGWTDTRTGKIVIVLPNHTSVGDVLSTLLHEGVAHFGLRKLFGKHFDTFLDNVYNNASVDVRKRIAMLAARKKWNIRVATEEYLAMMAEDMNFERAYEQGWWSKIKEVFLKMLAKVGVSVPTLTDNELRYILWRSYDNLKNPGRRSVFGVAEDIATQSRLGVGNYAAPVASADNAADGVYFREADESDISDREGVLARDFYEKMTSTGMYQVQEAMQDSMLGLKKFYEAVYKAQRKKFRIEDVAGFENAYLAENALSSVNMAEMNAYRELVFKPILEEVAKIAKTKEERRELEDYLIAKHGLERNVVFARRDAQEAFEKQEKKRKALEKFGLEMKKQKTKEEFFEKFRKKDYSGLTDLMESEDTAEAEELAAAFVEEYEKEHDTEALWEKIDAATKATLSKQYECGLMDKATYEKVNGMFEHYVPLRGWDEKTGDDVYAYLNHKSSAFNSVMKTAKGRGSKADSPLANIANMAESGILQGNRNRMKQKFLNFVLNNPSDLASVNRLWVRYDEATDEWVAVFADINDNDSPEQVKEKVEKFEQTMKELAAKEPDKYRRAREKDNVPYKVTKEMLRGHQVMVSRGGEDYVITINGNPRAAEALNGQTNPDNDMTGAIGAILEGGKWINRQLSAFYTTRNPDFVLSNFVRDMVYANTMVWVKENPRYARRFHRNYMKVNPVVLGKLLKKYRKGELDMGNETERMFRQFMENGGETGYANIKDIEKKKKEIAHELKNLNGKMSVKRGLELFGERLDDANRAVENCARFAAFMTSRQMGRDMERSVWDAKDISVNFNKKGAGSKFLRATGQTKEGNAAAFVSGLGRSTMVFWNAAVQGLANIGRVGRKNPAGLLAGAASTFLLGMLVAALAGDGDDDDEDENAYYNIPDFVRRSNLMFRIGDQWVTIPLPIEYRAVYGLGELAMSVGSGKEKLTGGEIATKVAEQLSQILPVDIMEGEGGWRAFVPSYVKPAMEVYTNRSWTGMPIYKDSDFNRNMPGWTKAYRSANKQLVWLARTMNEATGGDKYTKVAVNINPAAIEHILKGYFGGFATLTDKLIKTGETVIGKRDFDWRSIPVANRFVKNGDERTAFRKAREDYFRYMDEFEVTQQRMRGYENEEDMGVFKYAEKLDFLYNSPKYERYEIIKEDYLSDIKALQDELKEAVGKEDEKEIQRDLDLLISDLVRELKATEE